MTETFQLPTFYQEFIAKSRYARWVPEKKRRETFEEVVDRLLGFWIGKGFLEEGDDTHQELRAALLNLDVMPSMRTLMTAGPALDRCNVAGFNCSYLPISDLESFDETMYILMCGTGVGFSVEKHIVAKLPPLPETIEDDPSTVIVVQDSKQGWAEAFRQLNSLLWSGRAPRIDYSLVRPAGAPLKTFGGRASGPEPLVNLFNFVIDLTKKAAGRQLRPIEVHDIVCKTAEVVVVGGVRRSALISLSSVDDKEMALAKSGEWWVEHPHRALANNSAVYDEKPSMDVFLEEWTSLYKSYSGERGIFSRSASRTQAQRFGRKADEEYGTNPCSEIILRPYQFCNLSEVVVRATDTLQDLHRKVRLATILGTFQSSLVDFQYLRPIWRENTAEECLLGVSLTGIMDNPLTSNLGGSDNFEEMLRELRESAVAVNQVWSEKIGVNDSKSITCVKPSGTVSQLVDSASGIHPRYSDYYIRRVRCDSKDPMAQFMRDKCFPCEEDFYNKNNLVFSFPCKAPDNAVTRDEMTCLQQLDLWLAYYKNWCEHKPSITVYYKADDFLELGHWVYEHFDDLSGVSFLPHTDHTYEQAPYEEINYETFEALQKKLDSLDFSWEDMSAYEDSDMTEGAQNLACVGGVCEL